MVEIPDEILLLSKLICVLHVNNNYVCRLNRHSCNFCKTIHSCKGVGKGGGACKGVGKGGLGASDFKLMAHATMCTSGYLKRTSKSLEKTREEK